MGFLQTIWCFRPLSARPDKGKGKEPEIRTTSNHQSSQSKVAEVVKAARVDKQASQSKGGGNGEGGSCG